MARRAPSSSVLSRLTPKSDAEFIALARKRFKQAESAETEQREREREDLGFYAGYQWPEDILAARQGQPGNQNLGLPPVPARPSLTINKVREPVRQVLNQERQSDLGVEIVATEDFGEAGPQVTPEELELREGLVRRIQRDSQAHDARSWAFVRATIAGRGYYRINTRFVGGRSMDQEVYVDRIYNQASVLLDPFHEQPDGSDAEWEFIGADLPWDRYQAEHGKVKDKANAIRSLSQTEWRALGDEAPGWFTGEGDTRAVRVVEYFRTVREPVEVVQLVNGQVIDAADLTDTDEVATDDEGEEIRRTDVKKTIKWAKIDGIQVLDETDWPSQYMPIVKVLGEELQPFDGQRRAEGMVRPSRDSQRGFNAMVSKWVEQIGLAPIPPWMGAAGFDEGFQNEYALANTRTLPALHFNRKDLDGNPIDPPTRTSIATDIQAIAASVQLFDQAIKSTTAVPDSSLGNVDTRVRSKVAIQALVQNAQQGTSHFLDNLKRSIRYEGMIENDLLYPIYGKKGRIARMMTSKGETQAIRINAPFITHPKTKQPVTALPGPSGQPVPVTDQTQGAKVYTLSPDANFGLTVKVSRAYDTTREQQETLLSELIQAEPQLMGVFGDLLFKYNDGPGHEQLEERAKVMLVPPVQALLKGGQPLPPEAQQQMAQMQAVIQELKQAADDNQTKQIIAAGADATKLKVAGIQAQTTITAAEIKAGMDDLKAQIQVLATLIGTAHEERMAEKDHQFSVAQGLHQAAHEVGTTLLEHEHAKELATMQHQQTLEQGDQAHQQTLEQGQQAAALQPPPEAGG